MTRTVLAFLEVMAGELVDIAWAHGHRWLLSAAAREAQAFARHYPEALPQTTRSARP